MTDDLHEIQASICRELLFRNGSSFSALNQVDIPNDHFSYHLRQLLKQGIITKKDHKYYLTQTGKTFVSKLDIDRLVIEKQGTVSVAVTAKKVIRGQTKILIQQRLKEPFYGYYGFINGKVRFGESSKACAQRELKEETGLTGDPQILCVYHKRRGPNERQIKLDNFFLVYLIKQPHGKLVNTIEGRNYWLTEDQIYKLKIFPGFISALKIVITEKYTPYFEEYIQLDNI